MQQIKTIDIPLDQLTDIEELFFRQIRMDAAKAIEKFSSLIDKTKKISLATINCQGIFGIFQIENSNDGTLRINGGEILKSAMLAEVLNKSEQLAIFAITAHGYESLDEKAGTLIEKLFYDAWGTALIEAATTWLQGHIKTLLSDKGFHMTCSWSPGQHNVSIGLQHTVFRMIHPQQIGISLDTNMMMHPKKSGTGICGISRDPSLTSARACDFCTLRKSCPSAYAVKS